MRTASSVSVTGPNLIELDEQRVPDLVGDAFLQEFPGS